MADKSFNYRYGLRAKPLFGSPDGTLWFPQELSFPQKLTPLNLLGLLFGAARDTISSPSDRATRVSTFRVERDLNFRSFNQIGVNRSFSIVTQVRQEICAQIREDSDSDDKMGAYIKS